MNNTMPTLYAAIGDRFEVSMLTSCCLYCNKHGFWKEKALSCADLWVLRLTFLSTWLKLGAHGCQARTHVPGALAVSSRFAEIRV